MPSDNQESKGRRSIAMQMAKVSSKYQIVIPKSVREALGLRPGDRLLIVTEGDKAVMRLRPRSYSEHMRGLHKEVWQGIDATEYVREERKSWEQEP
jgi:AbrB family looped-hinge helix DNA binding protein